MIYSAKYQKEKTSFQFFHQANCIKSQTICLFKTQDPFHFKPQNPRYFKSQNPWPEQPSFDLQEVV